MSKGIASIGIVTVLVLACGCITLEKKPPYVESTKPANLQTNATTNTTIVIRFSEPVDRQSAEAAFIMFPLVEGSFSWDTEATEMTFKPTEPLRPLAQYQFTIQATVRDETGDQMTSPYTFSFKVAEAPLQQPALEGFLEWVMEYPEEYKEFGGNRDKWTTYQVKREDIILSFKPTEGEATSAVSILLDLGEVDFTEANQTWTERDGLYQWRFVGLDCERSIRVTIMAPQLPAGVEEKGYLISMYYQYPDKPQNMLDQETLTVKLLE